MNHYILAMQNSLYEAALFFESATGMLSEHGEDAVRQAVCSRGIPALQSARLKCVLLSEAQLRSSWCREVRTEAVLKDRPLVKPVAYVDLDVFRDIVLNVCPGYPGEPDHDDYYAVISEIAQQIAPSVQLVRDPH